MDKTVNLLIDNIPITANEGETILQAAKRASIKIPTLCFLKNVHEEGNCRVCVVEIAGKKNLVTSCNTKVCEGMQVTTNSERVINSRKTAIELMLSNHQKDCLSCGKNLKCDLQRLSKEFMCDEHKFSGEVNKYDVDDSSPCIVRNNNKCILCGRCIAVCKKIQETSAIAKQKRGFETSVGCSFDMPLGKSTCVGCGQCILVCPTGALLESSSINAVLNLLKDSNNYVVAQIAPAVRVALAEEFGYPIGTFNEGKIATALRKIGFKKAFDVNVGADFTVIEESEELIERLQSKKNLPLFSSCCPAWFDYIHKNYSEFSTNVSTCKTPNEMLGSLIKNYYAKKENLNNVKVVAIMPCTAKKAEILRRNDVDAVLTTRELAYLITSKNIDYKSLPEEEFDKPFGDYGAGLIFGAGGGVTEAVLRTAYEKITGKKSNPSDFYVARSMDGIKEVSIDKDNVKLSICVISGLSNANKVLKQIKSGEKHYDFVEVMACPGGCINGGGQPFVNYNEIDLETVIKKRTEALFNSDKFQHEKTSHNNKVVKQIYSEFLDIDKENAHQILHYKNKCEKIKMLDPKNNTNICDIK